MLSIKLSTLDETITYYRDVLIPGLEEQGVSLGNMIEELSSSWSGVHADTYQTSLYGLIYGNGEADSLALVIQKAKNILKALEAGEEVFLTEMSRCDEFPVMLTDVSVNPFMNPAPKVPMDEYLLCNYEAVESLCTKISDLMETDCAYPEGGANSQIGRWNDLVSVFESGLRESSYSPGYSNVLVQHALEQEYTKLRNFDYGLRTYHCNLGQIEENLMEAFGAETSESAKTLTREIYEVFDDDKRNNMRILYLSQKSPDTYTPEEMDEIHRILEYTTNPPQGQQQPDQAYLGRHMVADQMFQNALENTALNQLFRGYSAALQTKYATEIPRMGDLDRLSDYFYKDTLQRLANADGTTNFDQLNGLMKLNPDSMTLGDCKALSEVFDQLMTDTERESVDAANQFLANCYIREVTNLALEIDAERSPVFDQWSEYYLEHTKISKSDIMVLNGREESEVGEMEALNARMMKIELVEMLQGNAFSDMELHYAWIINEETQKESAYRVLFEMKQMENMGGEDYKLTFHSTVESGYKETVLEHMGYRRGTNMYQSSAEYMKANYQDMKTDMEKYYKERTATFVWNIAGGKVLEGTGGLAPVISTGGEVLSYYTDIQKELRKNVAIDSAVTRDLYMQMLGAQQTGGQITYVNGEAKLNYSSTDIARQIALYEEFNRQLTTDKDDNPNIEELFPDGIIPGPMSEKYDTAFVAWYHSGLGDAKRFSGLDRINNDVGFEDKKYKEFLDRIAILRGEKENGGLIIYE